MPEEYDDLDRTIDDVLAGASRRDTDPDVLWLAAAARPAPPTGLVTRVDATVRRRADRPGRLLSIVALLLATAFVFQGVGNILAGDWVAANLGEPYGPHAYVEGAIALIALGACAAAAAVRRSWAGVSALTCTPLAVGLGLHGVGEIGQFAAGAALHLTEGVLGLLLLWAWWRESHRARRDTRNHAREEVT